MSLPPLPRIPRTKVGILHVWPTMIPPGAYRDRRSIVTVGPAAQIILGSIQRGHPIIGGMSMPEWWGQWIAYHDADWFREAKVAERPWSASLLVQGRWQKIWAGQAAWVHQITSPDSPRFLLRGAGRVVDDAGEPGGERNSDRGYTSSPARAIHDAGEAVSDEWLERFAREGRERRAEMLSLLDYHGMLDLANQMGVDVTPHLEAIQRTADDRRRRMIRQLAKLPDAA